MLQAMTKTNEIRPGGPQAPTLQEKEAQQVQQPQRGRISAQDAARIAQQAGFQRGAHKKGKLDIGDSSHAPIPLPGDDVDTEQWSAEKLDGAQESLAMAGAQFGEIAHGGEAGLADAVAGSSFLPTEEGTQRLEDLAKRQAPEPIPMDEVSTNVERLFQIKLGEAVPLGHKVLATGLVVAGEAGSVDVGAGGINEKKLAGGLKKVTERGNQAVGEAQKMSKGINKELSVQRTFVAKR